ncbi:BZLF2-like protein [Vombatid gammaherpesvirus 1]|uniref:BZLF2-like protein n=1 Tax=Vombatid gammaherpesvirus 1 TaxID=2052651 RepID=A0A3S8D7N7_9GAMA|nr:BZLF2-like protein [Vombatid gammaherpesvirus 1]AZB49149.1 BZLF2-like protein [Vombatid gammaherpesvirus 1]
MGNKSCLSHLFLLIVCIIIAKVMLIFMFTILAINKNGGKGWGKDIGPVETIDAIVKLNVNIGPILDGPVHMTVVKLPPVVNRYYQSFMKFIEDYNRSVITGYYRDPSCYLYNICSPTLYDFCHYITPGLYTYQQCFDVCGGKCTYFSAPGHAQWLQDIKQQLQHDESFWLGLIKLENISVWRTFESMHSAYIVHDLQGTFCPYTAKYDSLIRTDATCTSYRKCLCLSHVGRAISDSFRLNIDRQNTSFIAHKHNDGHTSLTIKSFDSASMKTWLKNHNIQYKAYVNSLIQFQSQQLARIVNFRPLDYGSK